MSADGSASGRGVALTALTGGWMASAGPMALVATALIFLGLLGSPSSAPPTNPDESRKVEPVNKSSPAREPSAADVGVEAFRTLQPLWTQLAVAPAVVRVDPAGNARPQDHPSAKGGTDGVVSTETPRLRDFLSRPGVRAKIDGSNVQVLIATLPDPVETGSKYEFDMGLEAIQKAIESEGYLIDHFSNPWDLPGPRSGESEAGARAGHNRPACLVFRAGDDQLAYSPRRDLLVLLVAGESNAWGVQRDVMRTALECAKELTPAAPRGRRTVRILGPTYSGTAAALARLLSDWLGEEGQGGCDAWVCSGSATSVDKEQFEKLAAPPDDGPDGPPRVIYSATVLPDDLMLTAVLEHLADPTGLRPGAEPEKTVFLVESGTLRGNRFFRKIDELNQRQPSDALSPYTFIPFPRRLAQMRDIPDLTQGFDLKLDPKGATDVPLVEKAPTKEFFPGFDPDMTQWTDGEVIKHILATITGERARNVGVFASEVRNVLFLVRLVNRYCPDVQIFLVNNDLLFTYRTFASDFYGAVVASSFPLDSRAQVWSFPTNGQKLRRLLSNETDLGRYNAGLVLLNAERDPVKPDRLLLRGQGEDMLVYGPPFADAAASDGSDDEERTSRPDGGQGARSKGIGAGPDDKVRVSRPCVWINVVGKDGTWPLRTLSLEGLKNQGKEQHKELSKAHGVTLHDFVKRDPGESSAERADKPIWALRSRRLADAADQVRRRILLLKVQLYFGRILRGAPPRPDGVATPRSPHAYESKKERFDQAFAEDGDLSALKNEAEREGKGRLAEARRARQGPEWRALEGMALALETFARSHDSTVGFDVRRDRLFKAAYDYWSWALVYGRLRPWFERARTTPGTEIYRFETELTWFGTLSQFDGPGSKSPLAHQIAALAVRVDWPPGTRPAGGVIGDPEVRATEDALASVFAAALEYTKSLKLLVDYLKAPDENWERTQGADGASRESGRGSVASSASKTAIHKRWETYRLNRLVLDAALRYYRHRVAQDSPWGPDPREWEKEDGVLTQIDQSLSDEREASGPAAGMIIDKLADASSRAKQAEDAEALLPPVIDVDRDYRDAVSASQARGSGSPPMGRSAESILTGLPWLYHVAIWAWILFSWTLAARIVFDTRRSREKRDRSEDTCRPPLFDIRGQVAGPRWRLAICLVVTMAVVLWLLSRSLLALVPVIRDDGFVASLLLVLGVAMALAVSEVAGAVALVVSAGLATWSVLGLGSVALMIRALVFAVEITLLMLVALGAWTGWGLRSLMDGDDGPRWRPWLAGAGCVAALSVIGVVGLWNVRAPLQRPTSADLFAATRLPLMSSGVSPLPTCLFLGVLFVFACLNRLGRIESGRRRPRHRGLDRPLETGLARKPVAGTAWARDVAGAAGDFRSLDTAMQERWCAGLSAGQVGMALATFVLVAATLGLGLGRSFRTQEGEFYDKVLQIAFYLYLALYLDAFLRLRQAWRRLRRLLLRLDSLPLQAALRRLPDQVREAFGRFTDRAQQPGEPADGPLRRAEARYAGEVARRLDLRGEEPDAWCFHAAFARGDGGESPAVKRALRRLHRAARGSWVAPDDRRLNELFWACLPLVVAGWEGRDPGQLFGHGGETPGHPDGERKTPSANGAASPRPANGRAIAPRDDVAVTAAATGTAIEAAPRQASDSRRRPDAGADWLELAEDFVLITLLGQLKRYAAPLRSLATFLMFGPILWLLAVTAYPFQPQRVLTAVVWTLVLAALALTSWVFIQIDRDPFVSRVSKTTPNAATFDVSLITKLLPAIIPLVGLILAAFPDVGFWLRGIFQPIGLALK